MPPNELREPLVRLCRAAVGDTLRSVVYVGPETADLCYLRWDLRGPIGRQRELERALWIDERTADRLTDRRLATRRREGVTVAAIGAGDGEVRLTVDDPVPGECEFEDVVPSVVALLAGRNPVAVPA